jgi:hypothetical protein
MHVVLCIVYSILFACSIACSICMYTILCMHIGFLKGARRGSMQIVLFMDMVFRV